MAKFGQIRPNLFKFGQNLGKLGQNCSNFEKILDKFPDKILDKLLDNGGKFDANLLSCNSELYIAISVAGSNRFGLVYIYIYIYIYSKRLRPIPPGLGSRIWNRRRCLLAPCWGLLGSKLGVVEV